MKVFSIKSLLALAIVSLTLFACGGADKEAELAAQDVAFKTMMDIHDEVMPKMGALNRLGRNLKDATAKVDTSNRELLGRIDNTSRELETASEGMMAWMNANAGGKLDKLREAGKTNEEILAYIADEQKNIEGVRDNMNASIEKAEALVTELAAMLQDQE